MFLISAKTFVIMTILPSNIFFSPFTDILRMLNVKCSWKSLINGSICNHLTDLALLETGIVLLW